ncbi:VOC family protein [Sphingomonas sp.]|uniref:VOC family protein n=1 Tax=Sphingomonas sp. TaxID=28214 RepID=UPI0018250F91|nr:VOC family protein [Sphingomonas sp.]MBA3511023.1 VOC family protein [Sphingomonas sp.]
MAIRVKGFSWVGVGTDDYETSLRFFTQVLGLTVEASGDRQAILRVAPGQQLEIFGRDGRGKDLNTPPTIAFEVDDVDRAARALVAGGAELIGDRGSWNGHEWQYFRTPDGHLFEIKRSPPDP